MKEGSRSNHTAQLAWTRSQRQVKVRKECCREKLLSSVNGNSERAEKAEKIEIEIQDCNQSQCSVCDSTAKWRRPSCGFTRVFSIRL